MFDLSFLLPSVPHLTFLGLPTTSMTRVMSATPHSARIWYSTRIGNVVTIDTVTGDAPRLDTDATRPGTLHVQKDKKRKQGKRPKGARDQRQATKEDK